MTNCQVELVPSRERDDGPTADFDWADYLDLCGLNPAKDPSLFAHVQFMTATVFEVVCAPGKYLFIRTENGIRPARIETSVGVQILVDFQDVSQIDKDWFGIKEIVQDTEEFEGLRRDFFGDRQTVEFVNVSDLLTFAEDLETPINQLVKPEQYFEIQDPLSPTTVMVGKVLANDGGIVTYESLTPERLKLVHLASPFCHALGWAQSGAQRVEYYNSQQAELAKSQVGSRVPHILFERFTPPEHLYQLEHLVDVLDPKEGQFVCPGHVSEIINDHYVTVTYYGPREMAGKKIIVSRNTRGIYVPGSSNSKGVVFASPMIMHNTFFSWQKYKEYTKQYNGVNALESAVVPAFKKKITSSQIIEFKIPSMQYVEVLSYSKGYMTSGLIIRSVRDMIYISLGHGEGGKVLPLPIGSFNIFPCGFAAEHNIPFFAEPPFFTLSEVSPNESRFDLSRSYRSVPGPVFRKFVYSGRGRPEKKWNFMTDNWLTGDKWLPPVSIRRTCKVGDWIDAKLYSQLADIYPAGPMPPTIEQIVKDFYRCTKVAHRNDIFAVMDTDCDVPIIVVKHRWRAEHTKLRVPAPETARQFAGWVRGFLRCIGCCPSLLCLDEDIPCIDGCARQVSPTPVPLMLGANPTKRGSTEGKGGPRKKARKEEQEKMALSVNNSFEHNSPSKTTARKSEKSVDYSKWPKKELLDYLRQHNKSSRFARMCPMLLLREDLTSAHIVQFNDIPTVMGHGFKKHDAKCLISVVNCLRPTQRVSSK